MSVGAVSLLALSAIAGVLDAPQTPSVWIGLFYLIVASPLLFMLFVFVVRWTVTGASYQFVLFPIVSAIGGALVLGEVTASPSAPRS